MVQASVISVLGSRTLPWLRLSDASFARSSRRSGRFSAQVGLSATFPPCHNSFSVSLQRTSAAEIYRSRQLSAALSALPEIIGGSQPPYLRCRWQTDEPRWASENCERQQGYGEDGPVLKACQASVQAKVTSSGSGKSSCSYFCSHATSTSPCYRFGGNRLRGALLIKKSSTVFINDLWGTRNRPNHFLHLVPTPLLHTGVFPGQTKSKTMFKRRGYSAWLIFWPFVSSQLFIWCKIAFRCVTQSLKINLHRHNVAARKKKNMIDGWKPLIKGSVEWAELNPSLLSKGFPRISLQEFSQTFKDNCRD